MGMGAAYGAAKAGQVRTHSRALTQVMVLSSMLTTSGSKQPPWMGWAPLSLLHTLEPSL